MSSVEELLSHATIFRTLSLENRRRLAAVTVACSFRRGDYIFREEDESSYLYSVLNGRVKIVKLTPAGQEAILEVFGPGDPLGAVAVYEGRPYPASAVVLEDATCLRIDRGAFFSLLEKHPSLVRSVLSGLNLRLVELTKRITELTGGRVENRIARLFVRLSREFGRSERGGTFIRMALTRQELADMTGTTVETCIRVMSRWTKEGVIRTEDDGFVVLQPEVVQLLSQS
jgi:CRP/FNR family transcriptional regulator, nitrogen oxide reductase regulator